jgi:ribosome recycling factor
MLGSVFVDYYGSATPLSQVAKLSVPDARTIHFSHLKEYFTHRKSNHGG